MELKKQKEISEIYQLKHINDNYSKGFNYFEGILDKSLSGHLFRNDKLQGFLTRLNPLAANFFDKYNIIRNWKSFYVDKYKNDHVK
jgi:hypothetical protein